MTDNQDTMELVVEGKPFTIQYIQSKSLKWKYISVIPTGYIEESVNQIRNVTLLVVTISILLSVILTLYIINGLYKPMNKILSYINIIGNKKTVVKQDENHDEFTVINGIIDYVYNCLLYTSNSGHRSSAKPAGGRKSGRTGGRLSGKNGAGFQYLL